MRQRGRDFPYPHAYIFCILLNMVAQQGRALFYATVKFDNYALQLLMAAHNTVLSQTKEELPPSWDTVMNVIKSCWS